ncbi:MAG: low molecular weight protein-tyrosine-phosphatase [Alcanivoracaceae bacterium]
MSVRVLFVCLGNICRSPTAEGVFRQRAADQGLRDFLTDSAGTSGWHIGKRPDPRTLRAAERRGYDLSALRGRQVSVEDFTAFDLILAMDQQNLADLRKIAPRHHPASLGLLLDYADGLSVRDVPDPYYGGEQGFDDVLDMIEQACDGLITSLREGRAP